MLVGGGGMITTYQQSPGDLSSGLFTLVVAVIAIGLLFLKDWMDRRKKRKQIEQYHHSNADSIHIKERHEGRAKGEDNLFSFMVAIVVLVSIFVAYMVYNRQYWVLSYIFWGVLILLILYGTYRIIHDFTDPDFSNPSSSSRNIKLRDDKLMCKNGHMVSVYVNYDGGISKGRRNLDVTCGASVWPEKCPICGASWIRPGK